MEDIIPICNLDYIFEIMASGSKSEGSPIRGNLVIAWKTEPSSGGFFILCPGPGQLDELKEIIRLQHERKKGIWPPFDEIEGWGHNITAIDPWKNIEGGGGIKWDFYGAFADQGLLYMWTKYIKKDVSIVINDFVEHWSDEDRDGEVEMVGTSSTAELIDAHSCSLADPFPKYGRRLTRHSPYRDFYHFVSAQKPWLPKFAKMIPPDDLMSIENATDPLQLWHQALRRQIQLLKLGNDIDVYNLNLTVPPLGLFL